jgi:SOS response regulatory protein OraA/RecX
MKITKSELIGAISIMVGITSSAVGLGATFATADSTSTSTTPSSGSISRSVMRQDKQQAIAQVLNLTMSQVQADLKAHNLKQVVSDQGLSADTFHQKVEAQLQSELQAQGYSQTQIDSALQRYVQHASRN